MALVLSPSYLVTSCLAFKTFCSEFLDCRLEARGHFFSSPELKSIVTVGITLLSLPTVGETKDKISLDTFAVAAFINWDTITYSTFTARLTIYR